jgi:quercetin dioxygenase-like cupin family protein
MEAKLVTKPWGAELWITPENYPYALKNITFKQGSRTSLQVHEHKWETNYVLDGTGILYRSRTPFDIAEYKRTGLLAPEHVHYEQHYEVIQLYGGVIVHIEPLYVHRVIALTDLQFVECSTPHLDDVVRLSDDSGRANGRIIGEHAA